MDLFPLPVPEPRQLTELQTAVMERLHPLAAHLAADLPLPPLMEAFRSVLPAHLEGYLTEWVAKQSDEQLDEWLTAVFDACCELLQRFSPQNTHESTSVSNL